MTDDFIVRVHNLPAEIFNQIQDYVFTPEPETTVTLTRNYKPPFQLQLGRSTREFYAQAYYSNTTFIIPRSTYDPQLLYDDEDGDLFTRFLLSLQQSHRLTIRNFRFPRESACPRSLQFALHRQRFLSMVRMEIEYALVRSEKLTHWEEALATGSVLSIDVFGEGRHELILQTVVKFNAPTGVLPVLY